MVKQVIYKNMDLNVLTSSINFIDFDNKNKSLELNFLEKILSEVAKGFIIQIFYHSIEIISKPKMQKLVFFQY